MILPRYQDLFNRAIPSITAFALKPLPCDHDWHFDPEETNSGPWTGYIERCSRCNALQQIPQ